jgi:hypothetical protein
MVLEAEVPASIARKLKLNSFTNEGTSKRARA